MTIEQRILLSSEFSSIHDLLLQQELHLQLDHPYGGEKLKTPKGDECFDLMHTSAHIHQLAFKFFSEPNSIEIAKGKEICRIFHMFWEELAHELNDLDCLTSIVYRGIHTNRYMTNFHTRNPEWLEFWQHDHRDAMLKPSWYIFDASHLLQQTNCGG